MQLAAAAHCGGGGKTVEDNAPECTSSVNAFKVGGGGHAN